MEESYLDLQPTDTTTVFSLPDLRAMISPLIQSYGMRWARIFGSYARGDANGESDIDVLVDRGACGFLDICSLADDIYRASGKLSDVYDISELDDGPFRDAVLAEAVMV